MILRDRSPTRRHPHRMRWALTLLLGLAVLGCGDSYDLPALASTEAPVIRVLLGGRKRKEAVLEIIGQSWQVTSEGGRAYTRRGRTEVNARIHAGAHGIAIGPEDTGAKVLRVRTDRFFTLDGVRYPGDLILRYEGGRVRFVNETDLETYVAGVIGNEMAPKAPASAYRAQSVAARTYGWIRLLATGAGSKAWHLTDDQSSQVYTGVDPRYEVAYAPLVRHAASTAGVILTSRNRPFPAYYSSTCGGHTTEPKTSMLDPGGGSGPLRGVGCEFCTTSPRFAWTKTVAQAEIVKGLKARGRPVVLPIHEIRVSSAGAGGWAAEIAITYGPARGVRKVPGPDFRSALRLDSHHILGIERKGRSFEIRGRGWGHGVGMCQWGAMEMGKRGFSESEILSWYYPGASFTRVY